MEAVVWMNGRLVSREQATVSIWDHGLLYGDGVFEGMRMIDRRVFRMDDHLRRFSAGLAAVGLVLPDGIARAREALLTAGRAYGGKDAYFRLVATRGEGPLGVDPTSCPTPSLFCIADAITLFAKEKRERGLDMITAAVRKPGPDQLDPRVKSLNYLNSVLAKREARMRGADEALVLNAHGAVAEASVANVFVYRGGKLLTPPASDGALEGITRRTVLELAVAAGIPADERTLTRMDLIDADECFLTGTGARIVSVRSLDGAVIGSGERPMTARLVAALDEAAAGHGTSVD
jgi:branched-chain amino acid aminotransferase